MAHRDFVAAKVEAAGEAHTFTLAGETFTCLPRPLAGALLDLAAAPETTPSQRMTAWSNFIRAQLANQREATRFDQLLHDRKKLIDLDTVDQVGRWMVEAYTARPTRRRSSSPAGASTGGRRSSAAPSKAATSTKAAPSRRARKAS